MVNILWCLVRKDMPHTIGVEFGSKVVEVAGKRVKLQIWDTAGQERFRSVTRSYYRGAAGCLLVYDTSSRESYENLSSWLRDAKDLARPDITVVVVGNKCDKKKDREVTLLEASRFAQEHGNKTTLSLETFQKLIPLQIFCLWKPALQRGSVLTKCS